MPVGGMPPIGRVSMRFVDPELEASLWSETAPERAQQAWRNTRPLILVLLPAFIAFYATRSSWPTEARVGASLAIGFFWVWTIAFALASRTARFLRHDLLALGAFIGLSAGASIVAVALSPPSFAPYGLAITVMLLLRGLQVSTMPVLPLLGLCVATVIGYLASVPASAGLNADTTLGHALVLVVALAMGTPRMRDNHLAFRREYVFRKLSEQLVEATLPAPIAARLKAGERMIADHHARVSVMFADLVGFTSLSQRIDPSELAALLDRIFTRFDDLAAAEGVEKIKTIGDCYMAAAGLPTPCPDHALRAARFALRLHETVAEVNRETGHSLELRVGLDTGEVVAGVLGRNKLLFDLWGDAVNTASRMESHGERGQIQISDAFRRELGDHARVRDRGTIEVKGKGPMRTWFLDALDASAAGGGGHQGHAQVVERDRAGATDPA